MVTPGSPCDAAELRALSQRVEALADEWDRHAEVLREVDSEEEQIVADVLESRAARLRAVLCDSSSRRAVAS